MASIAAVIAISVAVAFFEARWLRRMFEKPAIRNLSVNSLTSVSLLGAVVACFVAIAIVEGVNADEDTGFASVLILILPLLWFAARAMRQLFLGVDQEHSLREATYGAETPEAAIEPVEHTGEDQTREREPPPQGLWWKSLVMAWLGLQAVAAVAIALGVDVPAELGIPALVVVWAGAWAIWRRRSTMRGHERERLWSRGFLGLTQRVFVWFCVATVLMGIVVLILDSGGVLERSGVPAGAVAAGVATMGLVCLVGGRIGVPRLDGSNPSRLAESYRSRFFARLAFSETPALLGFGAFLLLGGEAWVYAIGLAASLASFAVAAPTRASVRRDQENLAASGSNLDLVDLLEALEVTSGDTD